MSLQLGNLLLATGVGVARVEAGAHYPADVLAGAAIGHFLSAFIYDAFIGLPEHERLGCLAVKAWSDDRSVIWVLTKGLSPYCKARTRPKGEL